MRKRDIEAYDKRLAKIVMPHQITAECIGAQITFTSYEYEGEITGTLISVRHYRGQGFFGPTVDTQVEVCTGCPDRCTDEFYVATSVTTLIGIERTKAALDRGPR